MKKPSIGPNRWSKSVVVRFLRCLPFEYRAPAAHLLDDTLLVGYFVVMTVCSRRVFSSVWPAVIGVDQDKELFDRFAGELDSGRVVGNLGLQLRDGRNRSHSVRSAKIRII